MSKENEKEIEVENKEKAAPKKAAKKAEKRAKSKLKAGGMMKVFMVWPLIMSVALILYSIVIFCADQNAGRLYLILVAIVSIFCLVLYWMYKNRMKQSLVSFAAEYAQVQKLLIAEMMVPYCLTDVKGNFLWKNNQMKEISGRENGSLLSMFKGIRSDVFLNETESVTLHGEYNGRKYEIEIRRVLFDSDNSALFVNDPDSHENEMFAVYLLDETDKLNYIQQIWDQTMVVAMIYMDNYEEALESVEDVRKSLLAALVDRKVNKYISTYGGLARKIEKDKFFAVFPQKYLDKMSEEKFSLLEDVKTVNIGNDMAVTLSFGIGVGGDSYQQNFEYARAAIDMALGRGGDQAVLKRKDKIEYFGGKSQSPEKNTRVKARVKAQALRELIEARDKVLIMGHQRSDADAIGSAIGLYRAVQVSGKKAYIVLDQKIPAIRPLYDKVMESSEYDNEIFINNARAREIIDENTVLIVVDVNRPSITECPELLKKTKHIVVLDHHRQTREVINNAVLSYVEPYASSVCEMVAEILQYYSDAFKLKNLDADALYAGMLTDTNNFTNKTGVRTFEAAAFLRRSGADVVRVRKMFRDALTDYQVRSETVANAEMFRQNYAISVCKGATQEDITIVGAQAANQLLDIVGVKAAFVLAEKDDVIYISARSIDEVNVQLVMEQLDGGGHMNMAGAQVKDATMGQALERLKDVLVRMEENGEI